MTHNAINILIYSAYKGGCVFLNDLASFYNRWILTASNMQVIEHVQKKDAYQKL